MDEFEYRADERKAVIVRLNKFIAELDMPGPLLMTLISAGDMYSEALFTLFRKNLNEARLRAFAQDTDNLSKHLADELERIQPCPGMDIIALIMLLTDRIVKLQELDEQCRRERRPQTPRQRPGAKRRRSGSQSKPAAASN